MQFKSKLNILSVNLANNIWEAQVLLHLFLIYELNANDTAEKKV